MCLTIEFPIVFKSFNFNFFYLPFYSQIFRLIDSATDVEGVHRLLQDLLPPGTYYRLNPTLTEYNTIDETRPERLEQMKLDALMYIRKNEFKLESAARSLLQERSYYKKSKDWLQKQIVV